MGKRIMLIMLLGLAAAAASAGDPQEVFQRAYQEGTELLKGAQEAFRLEVADYQEVLLSSGAYRSEADLKLIGESGEFRFHAAGLGAAPSEALEDAAEYTARVLPGLLMEVPGLLPLPRVELAAPGLLFIRTEKPAASRNTEFVVLGPEGEPRGLLRADAFDYWDHHEAEAAALETAWGSEPWRRYLAVDVRYASGRIVQGMPVEPLNRLGLSLTVQGGAALHPEAGIAPAVSVQAAADSLFRSADGIITLEGLFFGGGAQLLMIQGGWQFSLHLPRSITQAPSLADMLALQLSFAGGVGRDTRKPDTLLTATPGISLQAYRSPRWTAGIQLKGHFIGPVGGTHGDWQLVPQAAAGVTLRL